MITKEINVKRTKWSNNQEKLHVLGMVVETRNSGQLGYYPSSQPDGHFIHLHNLCVSVM